MTAAKKKVGLPEAQYHDAFSIMLKDRAAHFYYDKLSGRSYDFLTMINIMKAYFETEENRQFYMSEWRETTLTFVVMKNPTKSKLECLQIMIDKLEKIQRGLSEQYQTEYNLRDQVINGCRGVPECSLALYKPAPTYEGVCADLRSAVGTAIRTQESSQFNTEVDHNHEDEHDQGETYYTDRSYSGRDRGYGRGYNQRGRGFRGGGYRGGYRDSGGGNSRGGYRGNGGYQGGLRQKKCHVCKKPGCWSTKHSAEERQKAYDKFRQEQYVIGHEVTTALYQSFLAEFEE
jgi:hypothetical protein